MPKEGEPAPVNPQQSHENWVADRSLRLSRADKRAHHIAKDFGDNDRRPLTKKFFCGDGEIGEFTINRMSVTGAFEIRNSLLKDMVDVGEQQTAFDILDQNAKKRGEVVFEHDPDRPKNLPPEEPKNDTPY